MRLVFANRDLHFLNCLVPVGNLCLHRLHGDFEQFAGRVILCAGFLIGIANLVSRGCHQTLHGILAGVRRPTGDDFKEHRTEKVHVALRSDLADRSRRHFGSHVGGRAAHARTGRDALGLAEFFSRVSQAPVHHEDFSEVTEHRVFGLQVAVNDAARVSKRDGIGCPRQDVQVLTRRLFTNDVQPRRSLHFLHRVEKCLVRTRTDIVNGHDVRVIELASHDRFRQKLRSLLFVPGRLRFEHLQSDVTIDRPLLRSEHNSHAAFAKHFDKFVFGLTRLGRTTTFVVVGNILRAELLRGDDKRAARNRRAWSISRAFFPHSRLGLWPIATLIFPGILHFRFSLSQLAVEHTSWVTENTGSDGGSVAVVIVRSRSRIERIRLHGGPVAVVLAYYRPVKRVRLNGGSVAVVVAAIESTQPLFGPAFIGLDCFRIAVALGIGKRLISTAKVSRLNGLVIAGVIVIAQVIEHADSFSRPALVRLLRLIVAFV